MIFRRLLKMTDSRPPDFIIGSTDDPYILRWWVIPRNPLFNIYFHRFIRSDEDEALHDHPWLFNISYIMYGEYTEHTISAGGVHHAVIRKSGQFKFRSARSAHRIELHKGTCWTLFITGPKFREWGFHCKNGWRSFRDFAAYKAGVGSQRGNGCD